jgi:hypothetical protein
MHDLFILILYRYINVGDKFRDSYSNCTNHYSYEITVTITVGDLVPMRTEGAY